MSRHTSIKSTKLVQKIWAELCHKFYKRTSNAKYFSITSRIGIAMVFILGVTLSAIAFKLLEVTSSDTLNGTQSTLLIQNNYATLIPIAGLVLTLISTVFSYLLIIAKESNDLVLQVCITKLKHKRAQLSSFLEASPAGIFILDDAGIFSYTNSTMQKITGSLHSTFSEKAWFNCIHKEDTERIENEWRLSIRNKSVFEQEFRIEDNKNNITWIRVKTLALLHDKKRFGCLGIVEDISEIKELREKLRISLENQQKKGANRKQEDAEKNAQAKINAKILLAGEYSVNQRSVTGKLSSVRANVASLFSNAFEMFRNMAQNTHSDFDQLEKTLISSTLITEQSRGNKEGQNTEVQQSRARSNSNQTQVLLVEDDTISQRLFVFNLQKFGIVPTVISDGEVAVTIAMEKKFDFILMDIHLPGMSGVEATQMLRSLGCVTPIIAVSSDSKSNYTATLEENSWQDFLAKPCLHKDLLQVVDRYSENRRSS